MIAIAADLVPPAADQGRAGPPGLGQARLRRRALDREHDDSFFTGQT
jgi:hypothetical protein